MQVDTLTQWVLHTWSDIGHCHLEVSYFILFSYFALPNNLVRFVNKHILRSESPLSGPVLDIWMLKWQIISFCFSVLLLRYVRTMYVFIKCCYYYGFVVL